MPWFACQQGIAHRFIASRCADEGRPKPHPDMLLHLMERMQVAPSAISPKAEFHYFAIDRNDQMGNPSPCWNHIVDTRQVGIYVPDELANVELELQIVLDV